jgi:hypothetical protein
LLSDLIDDDERKRADDHLSCAFSLSGSAAVRKGRYRGDCVIYPAHQFFCSSGRVLVQVIGDALAVFTQEILKPFDTLEVPAKVKVAWNDIVKKVVRA